MKALTIATLVVGIIGLVAAWLVVPEFRAFFRLDKSADSQNQVEGLQLTGVVTDEKSHEGIPHVKVSVTGNRADHDVTTDAHGQFVLPLTGGEKVGGVVPLMFDKPGYVQITYNQPLVEGFAITVTMAKEMGNGEAAANKNEARSPTVEWTVFVGTYELDKTKDTEITEVIAQPSRDVSAPLELRLAFTGEILGQPDVQLLPYSSGTMVPIAWNILSQEGKYAFTLKITKPPISIGDELVIRATTPTARDLSAQVSCIKCD
jgi:hypothetical protein